MITDQATDQPTNHQANPSPTYQMDIQELVIEN